MKQTVKLVYILVFITLIIVAGLVAISALDIPGNYKILVVQSGSMEPAIQKGALVVVKPESEYQKGDVITVSEPANQKISLTHRIASIEKKDGKTFYITKGDANNNADLEKRPKENVMGKVLFSLPLLGYLVNFSKTKEGLIFLIIIPAMIIIYSELMTIKNEAVRLMKERKSRRLTLTEKVEEKIGEGIINIEGKVKETLKDE